MIKFRQSLSIRRATVRGWLIMRFARETKCGSARRGNWKRSICIGNPKKKERALCGASLPQIRSSRGHDSAVYDERGAPRNHPAIVEKIVSDDGEFGLVMTASMRITNFARLHKGVQLFLPVLEPHRDLGRASRHPKEVEIITIALVLIESGDGAKESIGPFESDRGIDLPAEAGPGRIEEILLGLAKLEGGIERNRQRLRFFDLVRLRARGGTAGEEEAKKSRRNSHDASIKREERSGVNFPPRFLLPLLPRIEPRG